MNTYKGKAVWYGPQMWVELDPTQCIPHDPGAGCPCVVFVQWINEFSQVETVSATLHCFINEGCSCEGIECNDEQKAWFSTVEEQIHTALKAAWQKAKNK